MIERKRFDTTSYYTFLSLQAVRRSLCFVFVSFGGPNEEYNQRRNEVARLVKLFVFRTTSLVVVVFALPPRVASTGGSDAKQQYQLFSGLFVDARMGSLVSREFL